MTSFDAVPGSPDGSVTIVVFNTVPSGGWMLYFSGIKRSTVTSKFYRVHPEADELIMDAVSYLADVAHGEGLRLNVHVTGAEINHDAALKALSDHPHLIHKVEPVTGADGELFEYLFSTARNKKLTVGSSASEVQKRRATPLYEPAVPGKAVVTADASYMALGRNKNVTALGGTGWAIGFHGASNGAEVVLGSKSYVPEPQFCSANAMELHALRDAMEAVVEMDALRLHNSTIIVYSDSDYAVTSVRKKKVISGLSPVLKSILAHAAELSRDGIEVRFLWTKGHSNNEWNNLAHRMAARGRLGDKHTDHDVEQAVLGLRRRNLI